MSVRQVILHTHHYPDFLQVGVVAVAVSDTELALRCLFDLDQFAA